MDAIDQLTDTAAVIEPKAARARGQLRAMWVALRPEQWVKNLFVAAPLFFSQRLGVSGAVEATLAAIALFCAMSSSVYLLNDIVDREQDHVHPRKRFRPIAAGELSVSTARLMMVVLWLAALLGSVRLSAGFAGVLMAYWALNFCYSRWLKHQVIVDVFVVAAGYLLRVLAGAAVIHGAVSTWLLICTTLLALFIGFCKRRSELTLLAHEAPGHRQVLDEYTVPFLDMMIGIVTSAAIVSYLLYTASDEVARQFHAPGPVVTAPFVLYGFFRYLYLVYQRQEGGDPIQLLLTDRPMQMTVMFWVAAAGVMLYWR
ncbi:MAG: decaprenyl-phosphate phosphoribosyltransferase [Candidatus Omnitrophica bacterium]|nr:decaprenyl-phosphate phosphoribosyltransferase [Candidatus Omnitrophota bacterium]